MGCIQSKTPIHAYYEPTGELILFKPPKQHVGHDELVVVSSQDTKQFFAEDECYIISAKWLADWLQFALEKKVNHPGPIKNSILMDSETYELKANLKPKTDFRPVDKKVWEYLFIAYGGGPVITFKVPNGLKPESYSKGTWVKKIQIDQIATIIEPNSFPKPNSYQLVSNPMLDRESNMSAATANSSIVANHMMHDLGKQKMAQAKEVQKEINQSEVDAIGALLNKDLGKKKMEEARELKKQEDAGTTEALASHFAGNLADSQYKEAQAAGAAATTAQSQATVSMFEGMGAKQRFRMAKKAGDQDVMEDAAATMLAGAWRSRQARRKVAAMKRKRQDLLEQSSARKLQSRYRARLAKKRVEQLKLERIRLQEEASAIMLQSAWRCKKSREKVLRLKLEKQRLLEEGAALMLQSCWRIKQAKQKLEELKGLKAEKEASKTISRFMSGLVAKFRFDHKLREKQRVVLVSLHSARDILVADATSSDPYVYVHGQAAVVNMKMGNAELTPKRRSSRTSSTSSATPPNLKLNSTADSPLRMVQNSTSSLYKTKVIYNTLNPTWEEQCLVVGVNGNDKILLTMLDKDMVSSDDFLGQSMVDLSDYPSKKLKNRIDFKDLPIQSFHTPIVDAHGKKMVLSGTDTVGKGFFNVSVGFGSLTNSHCGWVLKQAGSLLGFGGTSFKLRYMILVAGVLRYYDDCHSLEHARSTIYCRDITAVQFGQDKDGDLTLQITAKDDTWFIGFLEQETSANINEWLRKIQYNCPKGVHVNQVKGSLIEVLENIEQVTTNSTVKISVKSPSTIHKHGRRASNMFFGGKG